MIHRAQRLLKNRLPDRVYGLLIGHWNRDGLKKYFHNTSWMFFGRIITFLVSFITIAYVARYLGPENLGKLSYAQSYVAIFSMFASLGIDQIVYRELIAKPDQEKELLSTAIVIKLIFGTLTFLLSVTLAFLINHEPPLTWLIAIIALSFIVQPLGVLGHIFNAKVLAKYPTYVMIAIAVLVPTLKLLVVFFEKGILYFAAIITAETVFSALAYIYLYRTVLHGSLFPFKPRLIIFKNLLRDSWPIMLVGATGYFYMRIDQVMVQHFINSEAVGLYEAAVRLTEPLGFIPGVIMGSLFPAVINARNTSLTEYHKRLRSLTVLCLGISSVLALILFTIAPYVISILYGNEFSSSVTILRIYVWSTVGTIAMALMHNYFVAENRIYLQLIFTSLAAILNVVLNYIMIPLLGITGAAYATLITVLCAVGTFMLLRHRF